jgi:hypothetical protein
MYVVEFGSRHIFQRTLSVLVFISNNKLPTLLAILKNYSIIIGKCLLHTSNFFSTESTVAKETNIVLPHPLPTTLLRTN